MALILASIAFTRSALLSWPPYFYIDRMGRRWTVMISSAACATYMAIIAGCLLPGSHAGSAAAVAFMFLYIDFFDMGILPVSWSYSAEIQPLGVRNKAMAVGVFSHSMSNFVVVMVTPIGLNNIGGNYFWIWSVGCACFVVLTYLFGVKTSGRTLEQVDQMFFDEPRIIMGLNPNHRRIVRQSKADEEEQFKAITLKHGSTEHIENVDHP